MKRKILFIANLSHNYNSLKALTSKSEINITELFGSSNLPLGILSIQAYITKVCPYIEISIIDLNAEFLKRISTGNLIDRLQEIVEGYDTFISNIILDEIDKFQPDVIGISTLFDKAVPTLLLISQIIKKNAAETLVIAGGHPVNNLYNEVLMNEKSLIDAICLGEGEIPFSELINSPDLMAYINKSSYFVTKDKCKSGQYQNLLKIAVEDLDDIPIYNYDDYFKKYSVDILTMHNNVLDEQHSFNKQAVIMTSRGCPYNCVFCASKSVHAQKMRKNSIERIKAEIDYWVDCHNVNTIGFIDDHFLFDIQRVIEICDYAGSKNVDIRFPNGLAIAPITKELVDCLVRNNVREVQLALESGSERVLREIIHKPLSIKRAQEVFGLFLETNIFVKVFLVVGFPDETYEDLQTALEFLRTANFNWASISSPTPISGSRLLEDGLKKGILTQYDLDEVSFFNSHFENNELSVRMNNDIRYTINLDINFVHNPYMRMKKYDLAIERFEAIIRNYPNHAFAYYYLAQSLEKINANRKLVINAQEKYNEIFENDAKWREYGRYFNLI